MAVLTNLKASRRDLLHGRRSACLLTLPQMLTEGRDYRGWPGFTIQVLRACRHLKFLASPRPLGPKAAGPHQD